MLVKIADSNVKNEFYIMNINDHQEIWVLTSEAAEITGYNLNYIQKLARKMWLQDEQERLIKLRKRGGQYELWLPDLFHYIKEHGTGPQNPPKSN